MISTLIWKLDQIILINYLLIDMFIVCFCELCAKIEYCVEWKINFQ